MRVPLAVISIRSCMKVTAHPVGAAAAAKRPFLAALMPAAGLAHARQICSEGCPLTTPGSDFAAADCDMLWG